VDGQKTTCSLSFASLTLADVLAAKLPDDRTLTVRDEDVE